MSKATILNHCGLALHPNTLRTTNHTPDHQAIVVNGLRCSAPWGCNTCSSKETSHIGFGADRVTLLKVPLKMGLVSKTQSIRDVGQPQPLLQ